MELGILILSKVIQTQNQIFPHIQIQDLHTNTQYTYYEGHGTRKGSMKGKNEV